MILVTIGYYIRVGKLNPWLVGIACETQFFPMALLLVLADKAICILVETTSIISYIILMTVDVVIVKYIFVVIATASAACVYPVIWPGKGTYL